MKGSARPRSRPQGLARPAARGLEAQMAVERIRFAARSLRGQVAVEFMLYTAVFMFVAVVAFVVVSDLQASEIPLQQNTLVKETGDGFVGVLTLAVKGGEGFSYNYTFPKTIYGLPYTLDLRNANTPRPTILIEWDGSYGPFSYQYDIPPYDYRFGGGCLGDGILNSSECGNVLMLNNDGQNLTISQLS